MYLEHTYDIDKSASAYDWLLAVVSGIAIYALEYATIP